MDKIEKIRKEIERRIALYSRLSEYNIDPNRIDEDEQLLAFIDSLEDKPTDYTNFTQKEVHSQGYDEAYLNSCIAKAKKSWEGVDVDKYMDMVRGGEPVAEGLEEEVKRYYSDNFAYISSDQPTLSILTNIARHFVEWQRQKDEKLISLSKDSWYHQGLLDGKFMLLEYDERYQQGRFDMKEEMMEGAVEGKCIDNLDAGITIDTDYGVLYLNPTEYTFNVGDKVKLIIVKED